MAYRYTEFAGVPLPVGNLEQSHDTASIESDLIDSIGSAFSYHGSGAKPARKQALQLRGVYWGVTTYLTDEAGNTIVDEAGNRIVAGNARAMLRSQVDALRAQRGQSGPLWRVRISDNARQWLTARLLQVRHERKRADMALVAEITCLFESAMVAWRSESAATTSGNATAGAPLGLLASNGGDVDVHDATLTVLCTSGTVTSVRVQGPEAGIDWTWTGTLATGQTLIVDCGRQTMRRGNTDVYSGWSRAAAHTAPGWLPLAVGDNPLLVTVVGGSATATTSHYNQFG